MGAIVGANVQELFCLLYVTFTGLERVVGCESILFCVYSTLIGQKHLEIIPIFEGKIPTFSYFWHFQFLFFYPSHNLTPCISVKIVADRSLNSRTPFDYLVDSY